MLEILLWLLTLMQWYSLNVACFCFMWRIFDVGSGNFSIEQYYRILGCWVEQSIETRSSNLCKRLEMRQFVYKTGPLKLMYFYVIAYLNQNRSPISPKIYWHFTSATHNKQWAFSTQLYSHGTHVCVHTAYMYLHWHTVQALCLFVLEGPILGICSWTSVQFQIRESMSTWFHLHSKWSGGTHMNQVMNIWWCYIIIHDMIPSLWTRCCAA